MGRDSWREEELQHFSNGVYLSHLWTVFQEKTHGHAINGK